MLTRFTDDKYFFVICISFTSWFYDLRPVDTLVEGSRVVAAFFFSKLYSDDTTDVKQITQEYWVGKYQKPKIKNKYNKYIKILFIRENLTSPSVSFVYEHPGSPHLKAVMQNFNLKKVVAGAVDEYSAMLKLPAWVGTRWDHGTDNVPGGSAYFNISDVLRAGHQGKKFWCEIAAKVMVQAATAFGWPARLVALSRDGYSNEHAVAELWSNQYNKWFVVDANFNFVFENKGIPLSAFELCHNGVACEKNRNLKI